MIPQSKLFLRQKLKHSLRMLSLGGEIRLETLSLKMRNLFRLLLLLLTMCKFIFLSFLKKQIWNNTMLILFPCKISKSLFKNEDIVHEEQTEQPQEQMSLRRSTRKRRKAISDDYIVFLQEPEDEISMMEDDPINFHQAIQSSNCQKWINAINEEYKSMQDNDVWDLVPSPEGAKPIGCKWIFKTKRDSKGDVERYKARLVAKGFTQKEDIDFT